MIFFKRSKECFIGPHQGHSSVPSTYTHIDFFLNQFLKFYFQSFICSYVAFSVVHLCNHQCDPTLVQFGRV